MARPVDERTFAAWLRRADADRAAAFARAVLSERGREADPVTVVDRRARRLPAGAADGPDPVVVVAGAPTDELRAAARGSAVRLFAAADLRTLLLYGIDPGVADDICERFVGRPARTTPAPDPDPAEDGPDDAAPLDNPWDRLFPAGRPWRSPRVATVVVVLLVLVVTVGALGGVPGVSLPGSSAATPTPTPGEVPVTAPVTTSFAGWTVTPSDATTTPAGTSRQPAGNGSGPGYTDPITPTRTPTPDPFRNETAAQYLSLSPTCERPPGLVVAIQVGALGTGTDAGIETTYGFTAPSNRASLGPLSEFKSLFSGGPFAPLTSYESVEYGPVDRTGNYTRRTVAVTDAEGDTAVYEWVLGRQSGGEYDGCWMTEVVSRIYGNSGT